MAKVWDKTVDWENREKLEREDKEEYTNSFIVLFGDCHQEEDMGWHGNNT